MIDRSAATVRAPEALLLDEAAALHLANQPDVEFRRLTTAQERRDVFAFRARVAINEFGVSPRLFPDGLDRDEWDDDALQIGGFRDGELVATARLVFPRTTAPLPVEHGFDLRLDRREEVIEVGRLAIDRELANRRSTAILALLGASWQHAADRPFWVGANEEKVIRLYKVLGATPEMLGDGRLYLGAMRYPVSWSMHAFAPNFHKLAVRNRSARVN